MYHISLSRHMKCRSYLNLCFIVSSTQFLCFDLERPPAWVQVILNDLETQWDRINTAVNNDQPLYKGLSPGSPQPW